MDIKNLCDLFDADGLTAVLDGLRGLGERGTRLVARLTDAREHIATHPEQFLTHLVGALLSGDRAVLETTLNAGDDLGDTPWLRPLIPLPGLRDERLVRRFPLEGDTEHVINRVTRLQVLSDDTTLVAGENRGRVTMWNLRTGEHLRTFDAHDGASIEAMALCHDGTRLVTASEEGECKVWNTETWGLERTFRLHEDFFLSIAIGSSGRILSASCDGPIYVWHIDKDECLAIWQSEDVQCIALSTDERQAVAIGDRVISIWDVESGTVVHQTQMSDDVPDDSGRPVALWLDNQRCLTGQAEVFLWSGQLRRLRRMAGWHEPTIDVMLWHEASNRLFTRSLSVDLWDLHTGEHIARFNDPDTDSASGSMPVMALTADGKLLITSDNESDSIRVWDVERIVDVAGTPAHPGGISRVVLSPHDRRLLTLGFGGIVWNSNGAMERSLRAYGELLQGGDIVGDGRMAVGYASRSVFLWDLYSGELLRRVDSDGWRGSISSFAVDRDGKLAACNDEGEGLRLWNLESGEIVALSGKSKVPRRYMRFDDDSGMLFTTSEIWDYQGEDDEVEDQDGSQSLRGGPVHSWDVREHKLVRVYSPEKSFAEPWTTEHPQSLLLTEDSERLIVGTSLGGIYVWQRDSGVLEHAMREGENPVELLFSTGLDNVAALSFKPPNINIWDIDNGTLVANIEIPGQQLNQVAVSSDGDRIAALIDSTTVVVIEVPSGRPLGSYTNHHPLASVALSEDGITLALGDDSGSQIMLFEVVGS